MRTAPYAITVELTRAERELLIRLLERVDPPGIFSWPGHSMTTGEQQGFVARASERFTTAETAQDLLDRLRRP